MLLIFVYLFLQLMDFLSLGTVILSTMSNNKRYIQQELKARHFVVYLAQDNEQFDAIETERRVANSSVLVVLITNDSVAQPEVVFALLAAQHYYEILSQIILVFRTCILICRFTMLKAVKFLPLKKFLLHYTKFSRRSQSLSLNVRGRHLYNS